MSCPDCNGHWGHFWGCPRLQSTSPSTPTKAPDMANPEPPQPVASAGDPPADPPSRQAVLAIASLLEEKGAPYMAQIVRTLQTEREARVPNAGTMESEIRTDECRRIAAMLDRIAEFRRGSYRAAAEMVIARDISERPERSIPTRSANSYGFTEENGTSADPIHRNAHLSTEAENG